MFAVNSKFPYPLFDTCWKGSYLRAGYPLFEMSEDKENTGKSRVTALSFNKKMSRMETGLYRVFWDIMEQANKTIETLRTLYWT